MAKRFAEHTEAEIDAKRAALLNKNTIKANKRSANIFREYLKEKGVGCDFETFSDAELDHFLCTFYFDARQKNGDYYKISSLENVRFGLNRYLKGPPFNRDIDLKDGCSFKKSNESFKSACRELKEKGKGCIDHYPRIPDGDLAVLYNSRNLDANTPEGLLNKVQFDVRFYFTRRGAENMEKMSRSTYEVLVDSDTGLRYVAQKTDEFNKNHKETDKERYSGYMPEYRADPNKCPVQSFIRYIEHLNPNCDRLWQMPKQQYSDDDKVWYHNKPLGVNTLRNFMPNLSKWCKLSAVFHNHSVRVTGATILTQENFSHQQIMAITGHKSVNSLAVYHRISGGEKINMGRALGERLGAKSDSVSQRHNSKPENIEVAAPQKNERKNEDGVYFVPFEQDIPTFELDFDINQSSQSSQSEEKTITVSNNQVSASIKKTVVNSSSAAGVSGRAALPVFHTCTINSININYCNH